MTKEIEINPTLRQLNNFCISSSLNDEELKVEYVGLVNMLARSIEPDFTSLSDEQKYQALREVRTNPTLSKQQVKELYKAALVTGAVALGVMYITRGKLGILLASTGAALKVPKWMNTTGKIIDGAATMYKGGSMIKDALTNNVIYSAEVAKDSIYGKFMNSDSNRFKFELPDIKVDISSDKLPLTEILNSDKVSNPVAAGLINWIKEEIQDKEIFTSKAELEIFLEKYITKIGEVQEASLQNLFDAEREKNKLRALEERDTAALCQSIHGAISLAISNFAAPKEAAILNTLIVAGFQYAILGMTPVGWAAVGISIATTLFSKSPNNGFEEAVLKALQQIQKQLNFIIEQIEVLQKNQIEILVQLNEILTKIGNLEDIVTTEFQNLNEKIDLIYNTILITGRETIENDYLSAENALLDAYNNKQWGNFYSNLQKLRDIAKDRLDDAIITKYDAGLLKAEFLKKQVLFEQKYKMNISLYDSIGLVSAYYNYNPSTDRGSTDFKPIHPLEFSVITDSIIGWLIVSELTTSEKTGLANDLLKAAETNNKNIKRIAEQKVVADKADLYEKVSFSLLSSLFEFLQVDEKQKTIDKANLLRKFNLLSNTKVELGNFVDESMKDVNAAPNFLDNRNDHKFYNLAKDLKLCNDIVTITKDDPKMVKKSKEEFQTEIPKKNRDRYFPQFSIGHTNGLKNNRISFTNVLLDKSMNLYISFEVFYTGKLIITGLNDTPDFERSGGHDGQYDYYKIRRSITSTKTEFEYDPSWKKAVTDQCQEKGYNIKNIIPNFDELHFNNFLNILISQAFWLLKYDLIQSAGKHINQISFTNFDGIGMALMTLSKLNNLVTSDNPNPYVIDYSDELFIREDLVSALNGILETNMDNEGKEIFNRILNESSLDNTNDKQKSIFYLKKNSGFTDKLNPERFVDLCVILLKEKIHNTIKSSLANTAIVEDKHSEPFTEQAIKKIRWYIDTQV